MCGPENGVAVPEEVTCTSNGWNINEEDYLCILHPKGPLPRDQILIVVFIVFVVTFITAYQYNSRPVSGIPHQVLSEKPEK